jgi:hypothetical protein
MHHIQASLSPEDRTEKPGKVPRNAGDGIPERGVMNHDHICTVPDRLIHDGGSYVQSTAYGIYLTMPLDDKTYPPFVTGFGQPGWGDQLEFPGKGIHIHAVLLDRVNNKIIYYCK